MSEKNETFEGFAILELMGHRRLAGYVTEREIAGVGMLRIDIPVTYEQGPVTQFYSPQAVYCITPTTEEIVQAVAERSAPSPVSRYELKPPRMSRVYEGAEDDEYDMGADDDEDDEEEMPF